MFKEKSPSAAVAQKGQQILLSKLKRSVKDRYSGISWQNPVFRRVLPLLDIADLGLRRASGRGRLPRYSHRIRSTGIGGQFGGKRFAESGADFASLVRRLADVKPGTDTLEVGCGCGRIALALTDYLDYARYTGIDVDSVSIESCKHNPVLTKAGFRFLSADVTNDLYNPNGQVTAREYVFPFSDGAFDVVFLHSVFTHMLPEEVGRYIEEIGRVLRSGGRCVFTTFLSDFGEGKGSPSFPYDHGSYCLHQKRMPQKAIAYPLAYFDTACDRLGMPRHAALTGTWRQDPSVTPDIELSQDVLLYERD